MGVLLDREVVRAVLSAPAILEYYQWQTRRSGLWQRSKHCPGCGSGESEAFSVGERGFKCHRCGEHGDLFALIACFEGIDCGREFSIVLRVAATIGGVFPGSDAPHDFSHKIKLRADLNHQRQNEEVRRVEKAVVKATGIWQGLRLRSCSGEAYLGKRGLGELVGRDDLVRFDGQGTIRIPLYDHAGRILNVPGRFLPGVHPSGRRILNVVGCPTKGSFGRVDLVADQTGPIVLCEGIFDYLSGLVLWPKRCVLGAHGASQLTYVARGIAQAVQDRSRVLYLVPDTDRAGQREARKALQVVRGGGLGVDQVRMYDLGSSADLNDWVTSHRGNGGMCRLGNDGNFGAQDVKSDNERVNGRTVTHGQVWKED